MFLFCGGGGCRGWHLSHDGGVSLQYDDLAYKVSRPTNRQRLVPDLRDRADPTAFQAINVDMQSFATVGRHKMVPPLNQHQASYDV